MGVMLINMMPYIAETSYQYLYVKRFFAWGVTDYSLYRCVALVTYHLFYTVHCTYNFRLAASGVGAIGMFLLFPVFHYFGITDNWY